MLSWLRPLGGLATTRTLLGALAGAQVMKQYRVVGFDANDERLYDVAVDAPNQPIAWMMVLAQMCRNFATSRLADRTDKLVVRLRDE